MGRTRVRHFALVNAVTVISRRASSLLGKRIAGCARPEFLSTISRRNWGGLGEGGRSVSVGCGK